MTVRFLVTALALVISASTFAQDKAEAKPLKALMITGGCCHDYAKQKDIISEGISARIPTEWTIFFEMNAGKSKEYLSKEGWSDGYDFILYNHCFAHETDEVFIDSVAEAHKDGTPAIALHCAMHSYHWKVQAKNGEEKTWPTLLGVSSRGHGPKKQITVSKVKEQADHPVIKDLPDGWVTPEGELYNVQKVLDTALVLAVGDNGKVKQPQACIWVNEYEGTKVFGTTLGHHNSTMETKEYLDMLGNAVKWATEK